MITAPKGGPLPVLLTSEWHNHQPLKNKLILPNSLRSLKMHSVNVTDQFSYHSVNVLLNVPLYL